MTLGPRMKKDSSGSPSVKQYDIGEYSLSYNPDDERFYVELSKDVTIVKATFVGTGKGYTNALQYMRKLSKKE